MGHADPEFAMAQCRVFNDWAWEQFADHQDRMIPAGAIATADLAGSIAEVQRLAKLAFKCLTLPASDLGRP